MKNSYADALIIQKKFETEMFLPNLKIVSVGIGINPAKDDFILHVSVEDDQTKAELPESFEGLELVVETTGGVNIFGP
jgi:hypothetical protein